jgi:hypothetical protein
VYKPSFLRGVLDIASTIDDSIQPMNVDSIDSRSVIGIGVISAVEVFNNDHSRYGGDGYPPGTYSLGLYTMPRGSEPDTSIGGGYYNRTLGGYIIGRSFVNAPSPSTEAPSLSLNEDTDIGSGNYNRTLVGRVSTTSSLTATELNN